MKFSGPPMQYPDPELERDSFTAETTPLIGEQEPNVFSLLGSLAGLSDGDGGGGVGGGGSATRTILALILRTKIQYRILAVIVYILFANRLIVGNIIVPLLCWEAVEVFLLKTYVPKLSILGVLFTLSGISPRYVPTLTKILETLHKIGKDVALFMYCFLVTHFVFCKVWLRQDLQTIFFAGLLRDETKYSVT